MSDFEEDFPKHLAHWLCSERLGRCVIAKKELASTNTLLAQMAESGMQEGLVVVADAQTGGMGRNGRTWFSPPGKNLYFSLLLRPDCKPGVVPQLAIVAALSLHDVVCRLCPGKKVGVKWPNDLLCEDAKLSGILCTMSCTGANVDYAVVGIGVNVNMAANEFPEDVKATSLQILGNGTWDRAFVLAEFLSAFEADYHSWLKRGNLASFIPRWNECSCLEGQYVEVEQGRELASGVVESITEEGHLRLRDASGKIALACAGDAHIRKR